MEKSPKRIGEILIKKGVITEAQLHDALKEQKTSSGFLGAILVSKGWVSKNDVLEALAEQFGIPLVDLKKEHIDMELARRFSSSLIVDHKCFPVRQDEETITVAIVNPLNAVAISKIEEEAKPRKVNLVLVTEEDIDEAIKNYRQHVSESIQRMLKRGIGGE